MKLFAAIVLLTIGIVIISCQEEKENAKKGEETPNRFNVQEDTRLRGYPVVILTDTHTGNQYLSFKGGLTKIDPKKEAPEKEDK